MTPEMRRRLGAKRADVSHLIRHELRKRGYTGAALARELKCSRANVANTITGGSHSPMVLDAMRQIGVPEKYLFDPRRETAQAATAKEKAVA